MLGSCSIGKKVSQFIFPYTGKVVGWYSQTHVESKFPFGIGPILVNISTVGRNSLVPYVRVLCGTKNFERILPFNFSQASNTIGMMKHSITTKSKSKKQQTPTKPRGISNYRWWKEVKKMISSKWTTFNKFGPNQFLKAIVWNEKKWSEIDYDSRTKGSNFFVKKWQKCIKKKRRAIHCKQKQNQNWKSLKALKRHWPFYIYICLNYTQNILWQPSQLITLMFLWIHCVPTCFVTTFWLFQSNSH